MSTYEELLNRPEWKSKREQIILKNGFKCQKCNNKNYLENYKQGIYIWIPSTIYFQPYESENSYGITIFTQAQERISHVRSYIPKNAGYRRGYSCVAYYQVLDNRFDVATVAFRKIEIPFPIISMKVGIPEGERSLFLKDDAIRELEKNDWDNFDWMFVRGLHVHHKYYMRDKNPWEYNDEALVTLCWHCHEEMHMGEKISELDEDGNYLRDLTYCLRCHGAGWFPEYNHIQNGICFRCKGARFEELIDT